jgi:protein tyrosine phosphatase (PTP) superfamily phosphohydrolase (DUF442 family)
MPSPEGILNYVRMDSRLACAGQPGQEHFQLLAASGVEAVLNLATSASTGHLPDEPELCRRAGLDFTWLPVAWGAPALDDYRAFQDWLEANRARSVLVHCAKNWRASMFCALWLFLREGWDPERARDFVLGVWEPDETWTKLARRALGENPDQPGKLF